MNREKLTKIIQILEKVSASLQRDLDSMGSVDRFAVHVYMSRKKFREVLKNDHRGSRAEEFTVVTYQQARQLGFIGTMFEWHGILWTGLPANQAKAQTPRSTG